MTIPREKIESLELRYLNIIYNITSQNLKEILDRFYLRIKLYSSWKKQFAESEEVKRLSDLGIGAERVFHTIFAKTTNWLPSSIPVGSNLFYECDDAFINIDIKSVYVENSWDYLGVAEVGERQTSYPMQNTWGATEKFIPQLPCYYEINDNKKICLSYILQIIHIDIDKILEGKHDPNAIALILLAVPNGLLYKKYGEKIIEEPKSYHYKKGKRYRPANFRYAYHNCPWFVELKEKGNEAFRVRIIFNKKYFNKKFETKYKYNKKLKLRMLPENVTKLPLDMVKRNTIVFEKVDAELKLTNYDI
jgi:hypothetical protein